MKNEIKNLKTGSGKTVCSEASTGEVLLLDHRRFCLDGMILFFQEGWISKGGSQITFRVAFKELPGVA